VVLKKHNKENNYTQNRLKYKASGNWRDVLIISPGVRNSTLSSEDSPHEASQSGQGGGRESNTGTTLRDHDDGGGAGLRDGLTVENGCLIKVHIVNGGASFLLKTQLIPRSHGACNS